MLGGGPSQSTDSYLLGENDKKAEPSAFYASISFTGGGNIALCRNWFSCLLCLALAHWEHSSLQTDQKIFAKLILARTGSIGELDLFAFLPLKKFAMKQLALLAGTFSPSSLCHDSFFFRKDAQHLLSILGLLLLISSGLLDCIGKLKSLLHRLSPEEEMCIN